LLTGATGLLGRYLLRDLLLADYRVAVLVRDTRGTAAAERIAELVERWSTSLGRHLPEPVVLCGDLVSEHLGLTAADRRWLAAGCDTVIHAAASLAFTATPAGEPWATNVQGTQRLLNLCHRAGIADFHHISTAYVCGQTAGPILEDAPEGAQRFHNAYEESKYQAECLVRSAAKMKATLYRPAVIVGDSQTGYTSTYHGIYRFIELASRLAGPPNAARGGRRQVALRLPLTGAERRNLVPVDWVAQTIVRLLRRPACHGRTYHLASPWPVPVRLIKEVTEDVLRLEGIVFAGGGARADAGSLERFYREQLADYWPYLGVEPLFDCRNLAAVLPDLPPIWINRQMLTRLIGYAVADGWGRSRHPERDRPVPVAKLHRIDPRQYIEEIFPQAARQSPLAQAAGLNVVVALDVQGPEGGQWTCRWVEGELAFVRPGLDKVADVLYRMTPAALEDVVLGRHSAQAAFFDRRIEVEGDVEKALKLAVLFGHFLAEDSTRVHKEATHALAGPV